MLAEQSLVRSDGMDCDLCDTMPSLQPLSLPSEQCAKDWAQPWAELTALKRMQRVQTELMMMLVHELRSPVATSKSMVATLRYLNQENAQRSPCVCQSQSPDSQPEPLAHRRISLDPLNLLESILVWGISSRFSPVQSISSQN
jgi:hypothetical protein